MSSANPETIKEIAALVEQSALIIHQVYDKIAGDTDLAGYLYDALPEELDSILWDDDFMFLTLSNLLKEWSDNIAKSNILEHKPEDETHE